MLLGNLGASLLENLKAQLEQVKTQLEQVRISMLLPPLKNVETQKYYQNEPKFSGVYSRNNLPKLQHGAYVINLDDYKSTGFHWIALYVNDKYVTYFDKFEVGHIPEEIKKFIGNKNIIKNIYRIQAMIR